MRWWLWPNVLSLDAPLVALLWHGAFAKAIGVTVNGLTMYLLAAAVWVIYVIDRLLDVPRMQDREVTRRHHFHALHERGFKIVLLVVSLAAGGLALLADRRLLIFGGAMLALSLLYGFLVHRRWLWVPKEILCGAMFSAGVVGSLFLEPFPWLAAVVFGFLCAANCLVIACNEAAIDREQDPGAAPQRWPAIERWVTLGLLVMAVTALASLVGERVLMASMGLASLGLLVVLHIRRSREWKRVMADVCLLAPLMLWPWL